MIIISIFFSVLTILSYPIDMLYGFPFKLSIPEAESQRLDYCSYMDDYLKQFGVKAPANKTTYYTDDDLKHIPDGTNIDYCSDNFHEKINKSRITEKKINEASKALREKTRKIQEINSAIIGKINKNTTLSISDIKKLLKKEENKSTEIRVHKYGDLIHDDELSLKWNILIVDIISFFKINLIDGYELNASNIHLSFDHGYTEKSARALNMIFDEYQKVEKKFFLIQDKSVIPHTDSIGNIYIDRELYIKAVDENVFESIMVHEIMHIVFNFLDILSFPGTPKSFDNLVNKNKSIRDIREEFAISGLRSNERMNRAIDSRTNIVSYYQEDDDVKEVSMDILTFNYIGQKKSIEYLNFLKKNVPLAFKRYSNSGVEKFYTKLERYKDIKFLHSVGGDYGIERLYINFDELLSIFLNLKMVDK